MLFDSARRRVAALREDAQLKNQIRLALDGGKYVMFFRHGDDILATGESGRITCAKMLDEDDEDHVPAWLKHAYFTAQDVVAELRGKPSPPRMLGQEDVRQIEILSDRDAISHALEDACREK